MRRKLFIVGCGDIASRALPALSATFEVSALARSPASAAALRERGVHAVSGDLDRPDTLDAAGWHAESLLHCAPPQRTGNTDERTRHLIDALAAAMVPRRLVYLSTSGVYGDCGGDWVDESRPLAPQSDRARRRVDAEQCLEAFCNERNVKLTILRVPGIYAADRLPVERLKRGTVALRAEDDVFTNHIHAEDLAAIVGRALEDDAPTGIFNASDDSALRMADYFDLVADRFGLARPPRVPRAEALARLSPEMASFMAESRRLVNRRLKEVLGVKLAYPSVFEGVPKIDATVAG